ncbi:MAG TPA: PKD domain-containing protein, partial [Phototrophicaceae bacterium]|nr:PKD domain-containing protein [Phototrophicaceae bacterium]
MWRKRTSSLSFLVLIPLLFGIILCASQMGLSFSRPSVLNVTVEPRLTADYRPWEQSLFRQVKPELGTQAAMDQLVATGVGASTQIAAVPTATGLSSLTTPTVATLAPTVATLSPDEATQAALSATPFASATLTPEASVTAAETATITLTATLTPTSTLTATNSPTATLLPTATAALPRPSANFSANPISGSAPLAVTFLNYSTGTITTYAWNFGDGGTSNQLNPAHTYFTAGTYPVSLTVTGPGGTASATINIIVNAATAAPVASFMANPTTGYAPLNVTFTSTSTGSITAYAWNFGDGGTSNQANATHSYASAGTYTVSLTVTGPGGSNTASTTIIVNAVPAAPVASFTANPVTGNAPLNVTFTNTSTGSITTYAWNFGDGSTSAQANPTHSYVSGGTYTASLTVTGPGGSNTASTTITVT